MIFTLWHGYILSFWILNTLNINFDSSEIVHGFSDSIIFAKLNRFTFFVKIFAIKCSRISLYRGQHSKTWYSSSIHWFPWFKQKVQNLIFTSIFSLLPVSILSPWFEHLNLARATKCLRNVTQVIYFSGKHSNSCLNSL